MRYYLDTNVLIFVLLRKKRDELSRDVQQILRDYSNRFYVSSVAVKELLHAYKTDNIEDKNLKSVKYLFNAMEKLDIEIIPMNKRHLLLYAELEIASRHKDPNDHIIISQAISDKVPIISSDHKFKEYTGQGLELIFNKR
jgi:PIN domain nuclease of toxin-antitoxin system